MEPFNIELLFLNNNNIKQLKQVKSLNIYETNTKIFALDGLFSQDIFGPVGSTLRNEKFGYIDLNLKILHPLAYRSLCKLKSLYADIMSGKKYAIFDNEIKDYVISNIDDGDTGYNFFLKHLKDIEFKDKGSDSRAYNIKLIKKYYTDNKNLLDKWLVLPAGLRDYTIDENGVPSEDEVNKLYRRLLNVSNLVINSNVDDNNIELLDALRIKAQLITLDIYEHFENLLKGKRKFIQGKWTKRSIVNGTRNVLTALPTYRERLDAKVKVSYNNTVIGLYQYIIAINPIVKYHLRTKFIDKIFNMENNTAILVNKDNLTTGMITIDPKVRDKWLTNDGIDTIINKLGQESYRHQPVEVDGNYLILLYDNGKSIEVIYDTSKLTSDYDSKYLRPITYVELFYIAIYDITDKYPAYLTRYPVIGVGSIYPTIPYVKTTLKHRKVELKIGNVVSRVYEYPKLNEKSFESIAPHYNFLANLGGDMDGDTVSFNVLYTEEAIKEMKDLLNNKKYYITPDGRLVNSASNGPIDMTLQHLSE